MSYENGQTITFTPPWKRPQSLCIVASKLQNEHHSDKTKTYPFVRMSYFQLTLKRQWPVNFQLSAGLYQYLPQLLSLSAEEIAS